MNFNKKSTICLFLGIVFIIAFSIIMIQARVSFMPKETSDFSPTIGNLTEITYSNGSTQESSEITQRNEKPTITSMPTEEIVETTGLLGQHKWIAFISKEEGERDIYLLSPQGEELIPLGISKYFPQSELAWSPDGKFLLFMEKIMEFTF